MASRIAVEGIAVNAFLLFKFVAVLSMKASWETRLPWQIPRGCQVEYSPWGVAP